MKKLLFLLIILSSCKKEETTPCNCGTIANDGADGCYWLEIRNDCSGNKKTFCFDEDVWMNAYVGSSICVSNEQPW
jgi:hypothetical protein